MNWGFASVRRRARNLPKPRFCAYGFVKRTAFRANAGYVRRGRHRRAATSTQVLVLVTARGRGGSQPQQERQHDDGAAGQHPLARSTPRSAEHHHGRGEQQHERAEGDQSLGHAGAASPLALRGIFARSARSISEALPIDTTPRSSPSARGDDGLPVPPSSISSSPRLARRSRSGRRRPARLRPRHGTPPRDRHPSRTRSTAVTMRLGRRPPCATSVRYSRKPRILSERPPPRIIGGDESARSPSPAPSTPLTLPTDKLSRAHGIWTISAGTATIVFARLTVCARPCASTPSTTNRGCERSAKPAAKAPRCRSGTAASTAWEPRSARPGRPAPAARTSGPTCGKTGGLAVSRCP